MMSADHLTARPPLHASNWPLTEAEFSARAQPVRQRTPVGSYEQQKRAWLDSHPHATPYEIEQALRVIARRAGL